MENDDLDRTLTLLWRRKLGTPQGTRGPKQRVSVDEVIQAGIAVADADGLPAFSMRKVADRLGLKLMSIYTYVPGRSELIGLMVDEVTGEVPHPPHEGPLRQRLADVARHLWDEFHRHPWLLQVESSRPWIGPHGTERYEWQLAAVEGVGLTDLEMDQIVTTIGDFTAGAARTSVLARRTAEESGISDEQWWAANAPILEKVMPPGAYPLAGRVGTAAGKEYNAVGDPDRTFRFGLDRLLDGVEALLRRP
ncbi:TetR/AcrR family transcriptional regulator C-terminal domain-containing protein [Actinoplanes sp. NEAU-A12]|uniref:TetR/AcrR family transcriptional regulator C-terminal domain-containing protein n=1 Tax=Actinoplanes sandaracinus TaxID=3045177 RepID=A0ABT6WVF0_9ACTN|nr:TetR/AcrR family transcriptional regulator C-terminal domain-containing protein [Actinoplanes sandaracinus]MDI6103720.1 TetR/AcrR family transcriptional regulator C-terminal domain-containing protein [Actinoplanes sandaracinus]